MKLEEWKGLILSSEIYGRLLFYRKIGNSFVGQIKQFLASIWEKSRTYQIISNTRSRFQVGRRLKSVFWKDLDRRLGKVIEAGIMLTIALAPVVNAWGTLLFLILILKIIRSPGRKLPDTGLFVFWLALTVSSVMSLGAGGPCRLVTVTTWLLMASLAGRTFSAKFSRKIIRMLPATALIWMLIGLWQQAAGAPTPSGWLEQGQHILITVRSFSVFGNPNIYGLYLLSILVFSFPEITGRNTYYRIFFGFVLVLGIVSLYYTYSRTAWILGLAAAVLWFGRSCFSHKSLYIWIFILGLFCLSGFQIRFFGPVNFFEGTLWLRVRIWRNLLKIIADYWVWGSGPGSFSEIYHSYPTATGLVDHCHQLFLQLWLENGVFSLLAFIRIIFKNLSGAIYFQSYTKAVAISIIIFLSFGFLETWWNHRFSGGYFWLLFGLLLSLRTGRTDS